MGMDGLLFFYERGEKENNIDLTNQFLEHTKWNKRLAMPYFVQADRTLSDKIGFDMIKGITVSASGFYGPQGRHVRLGLSHPEQIFLMESFEYQGKKITNYEMESAALAGLSVLMGHRAITVCLIIAGRYSGEMNTGYKDLFTDLIIKVLDRI
jgi:uridine phosphorylase